MGAWSRVGGPNRGFPYLSMKMPKRFTMKRGIAAECLEKIFSLECKTSTPGTEKETGSVLGLLLCKEFIVFPDIFEFTAGEFTAMPVRAQFTEVLLFSFSDNEYRLYMPLFTIDGTDCPECIIPLM